MSRSTCPTGRSTPLADLVFHDRLHAGGLFSYLQLGREEDPNFTIKTMVIQAQWPGASAEEVTHQVTERIEKKLEELESLDYTSSITTAGQTIVFVNLLPTHQGRATSSRPGCACAT